jgi:hypothetical protein
MLFAFFHFKKCLFLDFIQKSSKTKINKVRHFATGRLELECEKCKLCNVHTAALHVAVILLHHSTYSGNRELRKNGHSVFALFEISGVPAVHTSHATTSLPVGQMPTERNL